MKDLEIKKWKDIESNYVGGSIIIGNGASISVSDKFHYESLYRSACDYNFVNEQLIKIFENFKTNNFELILHKLWQAKNVNDILEIRNSKINEAYNNCRELLINVIRQVHPSYNEINYQDLENISKFISNFNMVFSLNYDLLLYWAVNIGNDLFGKNRFKDCFSVRLQDSPGNIFEHDWGYLKEPYASQDKTTLIFYLHGNLSLARYLFEEFEVEIKIVKNESSSLLEEILKTWSDKKLVPLCVCEANPDLKLNAVRESNYLGNVYYNVLPEAGKIITIYGWGLKEEDNHILKRLKEINKNEKKRITNVAISVFESDENFMHKAQQKLIEINPDIKVDFFEANSDGCWKINSGTSTKFEDL